MALYFSRIFTLILVIKLVASLPASRVLPEGSVPRQRGIRLIRGIIQENDDIVQQQAVIIPPRLFQIIEHEEIFHTERNEIISQILVVDAALQASGVRVRLIHNGVGYRNVTLKFTSARNNGIEQIVTLYGH